MIFFRKIRQRRREEKDRLTRELEKRLESALTDPDLAKRINLLVSRLDLGKLDEDKSSERSE